MKLITFTVPCYNSAAYMDHCIETLLTAGEDAEIILVDDGSKDDTGKIADAYAEKYPTIVRVIHQENGGHGEGVNQGIRNATGVYFKVVDSDDWLDTDALQKVYDTDLMQNGGHINGWFIPEGELTDHLIAEMEKLNDRKTFNEKYRLTKDLPLLPFAVGDGNHSMATAKAYWEDVKKTLTPEERENHPARYALCEIVNIHDESLLIEPIHRVMFHVDPEDLLHAAVNFYSKNGSQCIFSDEKAAADPENHTVRYCFGGKTGTMTVICPKWGIPLGTLQAFLDDYLEQHSEAKIDYIHGEDVVSKLGNEAGNMGFFLPDIEKNDLFRGVIIDGVLPRKTFSMHTKSAIIWNPR